MKMLERIIIVVVICTAIISTMVWWFTRGEQAPSFELGENAIERSIEIEAEGEILHYQENNIWNDNYFQGVITENQVEFKSAQIEQFNGTYDVSSDNFRVEFKGEKNSTTLKCDVHGKLSGNTYTFKWLLYPLFLDPYGYDIYDFNFYDFNESEKKLWWEGTIDNTETIVILSFPFSISHCKAHVWPE